MIRVTCPNCGSKLNAKDELAGQTRKCPKCAQPVRIIADAAMANEAADPHVEVSSDEGLPIVDLLERLNRQSHYLVCDKTHVVATWENNGGGWMYRAGSGFISAKRARESLPSQGDFMLVELKFAMTAEGKRLAGLATYQLATRWALTMLDQGDDALLAKVAGMGALNRDQKNAVRQALKDQFMRQVWSDSTAVIDYLANADYHSSEV
jgi:hypothetical protein